ncbi:HEAT repeat domain-containing protein [Pseudomonas aeruginosa]|uniref:HEAT repeat domain-containing protein n=1 Tax=Pseudomonas TaxID=286 RepID=UPI002799FED9|nr:HEAT repeat domain-containing protein [Pseudomonas aeruginosa]WHL30350.1 HEAT repeat domain-containing protein [Pseudomonas juntendi]HBN8461522.1 HEAT repeat domain-containing protein [Pseudomonas aeruginosa]
MDANNAALDALVKVLKDKNEDPEVRVGAAVGLGHAGGPKALEALQAVLIHFSSSPAEIRAATAIAIGQLIGRETGDVTAAPRTQE